MSTGIVWLRRDLRLHDHPALLAAAAAGVVVPLVVIDQEEGEWRPGAASRWWHSCSLLSLHDELRRRGSRLILRRGAAVETLATVARETGADSLHFSLVAEPGELTAAELARALRSVGVPLRVVSHGPDLLFDPASPTTSDGRPYVRFTPFWRACLATDEPAAPRPAPARLPAPAVWPHSDDLGELGRQNAASWTAGMGSVWQPGAAGGRTLLQRFLADALDRYGHDRDAPALPGTSRLSPHLHFGEVSAPQVWHAVLDAGEAADHPFLRQLLWREFAYRLLLAHPETPTEPLRPEFIAFPWQDDPSALFLWQTGATGYPLVDAGMRELWTTGWMHNRVRLVCASLLVKHLLISWQAGSRWFWDTLVDADLADNTLGWQWVAGCGADAAPYFRIFNPVAQGRRFDPDGTYVRRWLPALSRLPAAHVHAPWTASPEVLRSAGLRLLSSATVLSRAQGTHGPFDLGADYVEPIIDHSVARRRALSAYDTMRLDRDRRA